jgi:hypothetical protein
MIGVHRWLRKPEANRWLFDSRRVRLDWTETTPYECERCHLERMISRSGIGDGGGGGFSTAAMAAAAMAAAAMAAAAMAAAAAVGTAFRRSGRFVGLVAGVGFEPT